MLDRAVQIESAIGANKFLSALDPGAETFDFRAFDDGEQKRPELTRAISGKFDEAYDALAALSVKGAGVYVTVNATNGGIKAEHVVRVRSLFVDLDSAPLFALTQLKLQPSIIVSTSPGRYHAYYLVSDVPLDDFGGLQERLAALFGSDSKIKDLPRVMRLPGFPHQKSEPFAITARFASTRLVRTRDEIIRKLEDAEKHFGVAPPKREPWPEYEPTRSNGPTTGCDRKYAMAALDGECAEVARAPHGSRNDRLNRASASLGGFVASGLLSKAEVEGRLLNAARAAGLGFVESKKTISSGLNHGAQHPRGRPQGASAATADEAFETEEAPKASRGNGHEAAGEPFDEAPNGEASEKTTQWRRFELIPFDKIAFDTTPAYLVKGIIPRVGLCVIWGPPKCGKSFLTFDLLMHVALGWKYRGFKVRQGAVVYCALEGCAAFKNRIEAFRQRKLVEDARDVPFYLIADTMNLVADHGALINSISAALGDTVPAAICLDTLNRSMPGSESSDEDMTAYVKAGDALRIAFNCAVVIVHHCGHEGTRPRGHSSLMGAVDAQIAVKRDAVDNVTATVELMKDGTQGDEFASKLEVVEVGIDDDGDQITSCVIVPVEDGPRPAARTKLTKTAKIALDALKEAIGECGEVPPASNHIPRGVKTVTVAQWRNYAYLRGISTSDDDRARRQAFQRGTEALIAARHAAVWNNRAWSY